ncbi:MFS transporter [Pandoraea pulmonicola]|uniref:Inner membrane transport protein RhmT n=1 Tax=Pandoraea pulmonicola TaxID=93221 RepID=A0AAJ5CZV0_PANPU|nr:MFS transporter [Pandoraea pulmonicola]AJC21301.1 MFS transporter permease [Pandoraea pulmonicola]SUA89993.1 Inner membrane transport protein RhmT [Pandoraea pulmonicola]
METASPVGAVEVGGNADAQTAVRKVFWRFVPLFVMCFVCSYLDRINISFAKLQMQSELGLSDAIYGTGASIFFIGYFLLEVPSNIILHRIGARKWIARIMVTWGIASAAMMFVRDETWFYVLRFAIGALEAGFVPGVLYFFTTWFPSERRGRCNSIFMASIPLCGIIGGPISGAILKYFDGMHGLAGWQWLFLLEGIPSIVLGVVVFLFVDDSINGARWLTGQEKRALQAQIAGDPKVREVHSLGASLRDPVTIMLAFIYIFLAMGIYGLVFWMPQLIKTAGTSDAFQIGVISMLPYIVAGIVMVLAGRSSDRTGERRWHLGMSALAGAVGYLLCGLFPTNTLMLVIGLTVAATGIITSLGLFWILPSRFLTGIAAAGGIALINGLGQLGGIISPYMVGKVTMVTGSATIGLYAIAGACLVATLLILWGVPRHLYLKEKHQAHLA